MGSFFLFSPPLAQQSWSRFQYVLTLPKIYILTSLCHFLTTLHWLSYQVSRRYKSHIPSSTTTKSKCPNQHHSGSPTKLHFNNKNPRNKKTNWTMQMWILAVTAVSPHSSRTCLINQSSLSPPRKNTHKPYLWHFHPFLPDIQELHFSFKAPRQTDYMWCTLSNVSN